MGVYCGIDWAEGHHDIAVVDDTGTLLAKPRISGDPAGLAVLLQILVDCGDTREGPVPVVVETTRGLLVCWSPGCVPPAGRCTRSPRSRRRGTGTGTAPAAASATTVTRWCSGAAEFLGAAHDTGSPYRGVPA